MQYYKCYFISDKLFVVLLDDCQKIIIYNTSDFSIYANLKLNQGCDIHT